MLRGAEVVDGRSSQRDGRLQRDADSGVPPGQLLDGQAVAEKIRAGASVLLAKREPEEAQLAHLANYLVGESMLPVQLLRRRSYHLAGEVAAEIADPPLFVAELEIHGRHPKGKGRHASLRLSSAVLSASGPS